MCPLRGPGSSSQRLLSRTESSPHPSARPPRPHAGEETEAPGHTGSGVHIPAHPPMLSADAPPQKALCYGKPSLGLGLPPPQQGPGFTSWKHHVRNTNAPQPVSPESAAWHRSQPCTCPGPGGGPRKGVEQGGESPQHTGSPEALPRWEPGSEPSSQTASLAPAIIGQHRRGGVGGTGQGPSPEHGPLPGSPHPHTQRVSVMPGPALLPPSAGQAGRGGEDRTAVYRAERPAGAPSQPSQVACPPAHSKGSSTQNQGGLGPGLPVQCS